MLFFSLCGKIKLKDYHLTEIRKMRRKFLCIFFSMLCVFSLAACKSNEDQDESCGFGPVSIYELYSNTGSYSFAKLKISSIDEYYDEVYTFKGGYKDDLLVMECVIEEDFYGAKKSGTKIYVPIILSSTTFIYNHDVGSNAIDYYEESNAKTFYEKSEMIEWLTGYDYILAYVRTQESKQLIRKGDLTNEKLTFCDIAHNCMAKYDSIIPIKDNKIDLENRYYDKESGYTYDSHGDYTEYLTDGMSMNTVSENLRRLAKKAR